MTKGEVDRAIRDAQHRFDEWHEVTGALHGSYRYEVESLIEDAVHIGIRSALGMPYIGIEDEDLCGGLVEQKEHEG